MQSPVPSSIWFQDVITNKTDEHSQTLSDFKSQFKIADSFTVIADSEAQAFEKLYSAHKAGIKSNGPWFSESMFPPDVFPYC
ncbi:hypothetical protein GCM10010924_39240 [Rhizobium wenxiniae]|uniref:Uncharacterized protein n=1 Tax=Rhizobium wenxiniae TaxID=1737357 RepID=A0A7X0D1L2_9HYPH|nr:hypothetical protein [Rhizobium wenxiniae]GGG06670.1 hypothetical protein GCM10010924_39240 [Rhizobium wenxiniae]